MLGIPCRPMQAGRALGCVERSHLSEAAITALGKENLGALLMGKEIAAFLKIVVYSLLTSVA
jgi:hypothetical protein